MNKMSYGQAVRQALTEAMSEDERVFCFGEDVGYGGAYAATQGLADKFGAHRVRNTPILESAIAGFSVGAAVAGMRPVGEIMHMDFAAIAMDQIANQAAKLRYMFGAQLSVPMVLRIGIGGWMNEGAQHSQSLEAWLTHIPGLKVVTAGTPADIRNVLHAAIRDPDPVIVVEPVSMYELQGEVPDSLDRIELDRGHSSVKREGADVTVVTWGPMTPRALEAADELSVDGIQAEVVDLLTLVPLDIEPAVESVKKTNRAIVAHQAHRRGGYGAEVASTITELAFDYLDAPVSRIGSLDVPIPFSPPLESYALPSSGRIAAAARALV